MPNRDNKKFLPPSPNFRDSSRTGRTASFPTFSDPSNTLANGREYYIQFEYIHGDPDVKYVDFKAFVTDYSDNFSSNWNSEEVYGRNDPIYTFQGTTRSITLGWTVPAGSVFEAKQNLAKASKMMRFLYPSYSTEGNASTLTKPPLLRMRFTNLIKKDDIQGLLGKVNGFSFSPDLEAGWFETGVGELYPKVLAFSCEFDVIHENHLGWQNSTGLWEISSQTNESGQVIEPPGSEKDKTSWPYMPYGESADEYQVNPDGSPENVQRTETPIDDENTNNVAPEQTAKPSNNSKVNAQGTQKSNEAKRAEATDPTGRNSEPTRQETNRQEAAARNSALLNNR